MEDKEIIDLYFKRDEEAVRETGKKYGHYCFTVAYHILFDSFDSEECVNDTWLKAWETIPPERPRLLQYYLAKITRYFALDRLRTKTRQKRGGTQAEEAFEELQNLFSDGNDPEKEYDRKVLGQLISGFIRRQRRMDGDVFVRRYFYADTVSDIAQRYGISENAVSLRLNRMRRKLKEELRREGYL